jgi:hypothetical protein
MPSQMQAILWAEWRSLMHFRPREGAAGAAPGGLNGNWVVRAFGACWARRRTRL